MAYRKVVPHIELAKFPPLDKIQHFEGYNGPDGIKVKALHRHEDPSHFYDPTQESGPIVEHIDNHYHSLVKALKSGAVTRAAFESAWLAHAVVDGLTPAHHYPYEEELHVMYAAGKQEFSKRRHKVVIQGDNRRQAMRNNWQMWGSKGLLSTHLHFEAGVAAAVLTGKFPEAINPMKLKQARLQGPLAFFKGEAAAIHRLKLYDKFYRTSWTIGLARLVRHQLAPAIIQTVAIEWILAAEEAGIGK
ncbi:MAG: hypothetical protein WD467_03825 [Candidatus Saccharimonadales bacterium]